MQADTKHKDMGEPTTVYQMLHISWAHCRALPVIFPSESDRWLEGKIVN